MIVMVMRIKVVEMIGIKGIMMILKVLISVERRVMETAIERRIMSNKGLQALMRLVSTYYLGKDTGVGTHVKLDWRRLYVRLHWKL
jgi:hypothetical protein